jgi:pyridoxamine 5'-phosphate oxidase
MDIAKIRHEFTLRELSQKDVVTNPLEQFKIWLQESLDAVVIEPTAMHLSTVSKEGKPSGRIVLLKEVDEGFVFYTNYTSRKGQEIAQNPFGALTFFWKELQRQVQVSGVIEKVSSQESEAYFAIRPRGSQIGAVVSAQSSPIANREELNKKAEQIEKLYEGKTVERPEHWGGYRLVPTKIEFWQGRANRLHDRILYTLNEQKVWTLSRLEP